MKKIILLLFIAVWNIVTGGFSEAATQWNVGGSLRYATFWTQQDGGRYCKRDFEDGGALVKTDGILDWGLNGNTRFNLRMRSDNLEGFAETGYKSVKNEISTREYWSKYRINDTAYITIGQQKQLFNQYISEQGWATDLGLNGIGTAYTSTTPKIVLGYGDFALALAKPANKRLATLKDLFFPAGDPTTTTLLDADIYLPQLQARYEYFGDGWRVKLAGAYQQVKLSKINGYDQSFTAVYSATGKRVNSWLAGVEGELTLGPLFLAAGASAGQNWSDAGWNDETSCLGERWTDYYFRNSFGVLYNWESWNAGAHQKIGSWHNTTSAMLALVTAYQLTENLRFETGVGYRYDYNRVFAQNSRIWNIYLQAAYTIAPGFSVMPEIGYLDFGNNVWTKKNMGCLWYAGAKWRMDF